MVARERPRLQHIRILINRARIRIALVSVLVLAFFPVSCRRAAPVQKDADVAPVVKDTAGLGTVFKETAPVRVSSAKGRTFKLRDPGQRDSLRATLRRERALWRAANLRDYQFLLRVGCFCPGIRGWLLMEVRSSQLLRARDSTGKAAALNDWNTFSIDGLFDHLEETADIDGVVQVAFDPRWHFPTFVSTVRLPGPDTWGVIEARGLRPQIAPPSQTGRQPAALFTDSSIYRAQCKEADTLPTLTTIPQKCTPRDQRVKIR